MKTTLNQSDWHALLAAIGVRVSNSKQAKATLVTRFGAMLLWIALIAAYGVMLIMKPPLVQPPDVLLAMALLGGVWWLQHLIKRRSYAPDERGAFIGESHFDFQAAGFHARRSNSESFNRWSLVKEVTHTADHVFLWIDSFSAYVVPVRDLPTPLTAPAAAARIQEFMAAAPAEPIGEPEAPVMHAPDSTPAAAPVPVPVPATARARVPTVAQELLALFRLQCWAQVDGARLFGRDATLILLGAVSLALWIGLDRLNYEGEVELFIYGLAESAALVLPVLVVAWLISRASEPRIELRRSLLVTLGLLPLFVAAMWFAGMLPEIFAIVISVLLAGWCYRYLLAGLRSITGRAQHMALLAAIAGAVLMVYLSTQMYFSPGIWIEREADGEPTAEVRQENEQIVFEQSARLDAALGKIAPRDAGAANTFFVGFAGFGGQRVFAEEIGLAAKRIGERYGATPRSVLLINDRRNTERYPLATVPSLRHTLNTLGQRMNAEEDVLFLALSSHGSEDATVSVSNNVGYWRDLGAEELAGMLRESGIRWRVIVVSACYSGSFIEALRDENTIILTAAAANRTSFGCSDDNDLTFFGEAFYRDALPKAASLRTAFETARAAIEKRENAEGRISSNPQAHFGAELEKKLAGLESAR